MKNERNDSLDNLSLYIVILVGVIAFPLVGFWAYTLYNNQNDLPWYTNLLSGAATSFFLAFILMFFENRFRQRVLERELFYTSLREHGIKNMHHNKMKVLKQRIENAEKVIYISGYRLIMTLNLLEAIYNALKKHNTLTIKILTCPPFTNTYQRIFNDDCSDNYKKIILFLSEFKDRISFKWTEKPLFNDTYIIDHYLITSPYVHNRHKIGDKQGILTADKFFSLEITKESKLFDFFEEDFMAVWESADTHDLMIDSKLFKLTELIDDKSKETMKEIYQKNNK